MNLLSKTTIRNSSSRWCSFMFYVVSSDQSHLFFLLPTHRGPMISCQVRKLEQGHDEWSPVHHGKWCLKVSCYYQQQRYLPKAFMLVSCWLWSHISPRGGIPAGWLTAPVEVLKGSWPACVRSASPATLLVSGNKELWSKLRGKHTFSLNYVAQHGRQHHPDLLGVSWPVMWWPLTCWKLVSHRLERTNYIWFLPAELDPGSLWAQKESPITMTTDWGEAVRFLLVHVDVRPGTLFHHCPLNFLQDSGNPKFYEPFREKIEIPQPKYDYYCWQPFQSTRAGQSSSPLYNRTGPHSCWNDILQTW